MNYTFYNITTNGTVSGIIQYIDASTYFLFAPMMLLMVFVILMLSNKTNIKHGLVYASFVSLIFAIMLKAFIPYFNEMYILMMIGLFILSILILIFV